MKILLASDVSKYYMSGTASVISILTVYLKKLGHDVRVLTLSADNHSFREGNEYYISSVHVPIYPDLRFTWVRRHRYLDELTAWKPDIIHIHTEGAVSEMARRISRKTGAPIIMTMHSDYRHFFFRERRYTWYAGLFTRLLLTWLYRGVDTITTPSEKAKRLLLRFRPKKDVRVISNGIILDHFRKTLSAGERRTLLSSLGLTEDDTILVIVGRLSKEKNIEELIRYFPALHKVRPDLKLLIVGYGPDRLHLEHCVRREGLEESVVFAGRIARDEIYRYYKSGKIFICASVSETQGLTYLESLACGIPAVCRKDSALIGIIKDGVNGFTYQSKDEYIKKILRLIEDDELYQRIAEKGSRHAERFDCVETTGLLVQLYKEIINKNLYKEGK